MPVKTKTKVSVGTKVAVATALIFLVGAAAYALGVGLRQSAKFTSPPQKASLKKPGCGKLNDLAINFNEGCCSQFPAENGVCSQPKCSAVGQKIADSKNQKCCSGPVDQPVVEKEGMCKYSSCAEVGLAVNLYAQGCCLGLKALEDGICKYKVCASATKLAKNYIPGCCSDLVEFSSGACDKQVTGCGGVGSKASLYTWGCCDPANIIDANGYCAAVQPECAPANSHVNVSKSLSCCPGLYLQNDLTCSEKPAYCSNNQNVPPELTTTKTCCESANPGPYGKCYPKN